MDFEKKSLILNRLDFLWLTWEQNLKSWGQPNVLITKKIIEDERYAKNCLPGKETIVTGFILFICNAWALYSFQIISI